MALEPLQVKQLFYRGVAGFTSNTKLADVPLLVVVNCRGEANY